MRFAASPAQGRHRRSRTPRLRRLAPDARRSGQRRYRIESLRRLVFIGMLQDAGLRLEDIAGVLDAACVADWKAIAGERLAVLDAEIARLHRARDYLAGALLCRYDHPATWPITRAAALPEGTQCSSSSASSPSHASRPS